MSYTTYLHCSIAFIRETYNNKYEVLDDLDVCEKMINYLEGSLRELVMITEPKKFCNEDEDPQAWLSINVRDKLESLEEEYVKRYKLHLLLDNWNNSHNNEGLAIDIPSTECKNPYVYGDFIKTVKNPKGE